MINWFHQDDDYDSYNDDWKDDYFKDSYWDRKAKELPETAEGDYFARNLVAAFSDTIANAVKLVN